jgi:murein DD-endopeptidase MepM/ murein hydrolase activator NlpD
MLKPVYLSLFALLTSLSHCAYSAELIGEMTQGSLIRGKTVPGSKILLDGKPIKVGVNGHFAFGFAREADLQHVLIEIDASGKQTEQKITLSKREYNIQRIDGLPQKYVAPPAEVTARIKKDNQQVGQARKLDDNRLDFTQDFIWPAEGPISGVYGSQRVLNGEPKNPHYGVDVAAPTGTPVYAPADGIVTLFVPDMYYSGGTMIIDHGFGVSSTFLHLSKGLVEKGTRVRQGDLVAEIGATGRVTGAHLDWRMNWFNVRLDPRLLVPPRD